MRMMCPYCYADDGRCPEVLPDCKAAGDRRRAFYANANGHDEPTGNRAELRAEVKRLRREVASLKARPVVRGSRSTGRRGAR